MPSTKTRYAATAPAPLDAGAAQETFGPSPSNGLASLTDRPWRASARPGSRPAGCGGRASGWSAVVSTVTNVFWPLRVTGPHARSPQAGGQVPWSRSSAATPLARVVADVHDLDLVERRAHHVGLGEAQRDRRRVGGVGRQVVGVGEHLVADAAAGRRRRRPGRAPGPARRSPASLAPGTVSLTLIGSAAGCRCRRQTRRPGRGAAAPAGAPAPDAGRDDRADQLLAVGKGEGPQSARRPVRCRSSCRVDDAGARASAGLRQHAVVDDQRYRLVRRPTPPGRSRRRR